jgi:DtxR family Mn-dependent transcriptional regulator
MYLKAVFAIQQSAPPPTVSKVAEFMGVSVPSASEMLKRLEQQRYVRAAEDGVALTREGQDVAVRVVRRLRLAERLLTDILGLGLDRVYDEACKMEHVISPEVEARLEAVLGSPTYCPHGQPIPHPDGRIEALPEASLAHLSAGERCTIRSIPEEDAELVRYLDSLGLVPGAQILVEEVAPFNGPIFFQTNGTRRAIGPEAASRVRVSRA